MIGWPVHGLDEIPGIRRMYLENYVRYTFVRYGVPYVVAIECFDGGYALPQDLLPRRRQGRGALPQGATDRRRHAAERADDGVTPNTIDRPPSKSTVFTYHSPGDILPGTGFKAKAASRITPSIPRSASRSPMRRPSPIPSRS